MRVLFLARAEKDTGIYVMTHDIARKLREKGVEVDIDRGRGSYDLIHIYSPLPTNLLYAKSLFPATPIVCTTNMTHEELKGLIPSSLVSISKPYLDFFYSNCAKIICTSPKIIENIKKKRFWGRCIYKLNPINLSEFRMNKKKGEKFRRKYKIKKRIVLGVGSIQKRKGISDFAELAKKLNQYQFVWSGKIPRLPTLEGRRKLNALVKDSSSNIIFTGFLERNELIEAYSAADVFAMPTYSETFGLVIPEAASVGLPVVARDIPEFKMFKHFIITFRNQKEFEAKIKELMENKRFYKSQKKKSIKYSKQFDLEKYADWLVELYKKVIKEKSS